MMVKFVIAKKSYDWVPAVVYCGRKKGIFFCMYRAKSNNSC